MKLLPEQTTARMVLLFALLAAAILHLGAAFSKKLWEHDEAISYLAATVNQETYEILAPGYAGLWRPAGRWQLFYDLDHPYKSGYPSATIAKDLAEYDLHPPLYFWMLHSVVLIFGVGHWQGPILNFLITLVAGLTLFRLCSRLLKNELAAAFATALWLTSPVLLVANSARQYSLLALFTILLFIFAFRFLDFDEEKPADWRLMGILCLTVAGGLITHYHFVIPLGCCCVLVGWSLRRHRRMVSRMAVSVLGGAILAGLMHPMFFFSVRTHSEWIAETQRYETIERLARIVKAWGNFFVEIGPAMFLLKHPVLLALILGFLGFIAWCGWRFGKMAIERGAQTAPAQIDRRALWLLLAIGGIICGLYLARLSLPHAMGRRYLVMAWPLFTPALAWAIWRLSLPARLALAWPLVTGLVVSGALEIGLLSQVRIPREVLRAPVVISSTHARGFWPRVFMQLPPDTTVYAAPDRPAFLRAIAEHPDAAIFIHEGDNFEGLAPDRTVKGLGGFILPKVGTDKK